jgi:hypothetical protein
VPPSPSRASEPGAVVAFPIALRDAKRAAKERAAEECRLTSLTSEADRGRTHITGEKVMELRIHLKVCEGCGCLWYRTHVETTVYCTSCKDRFNEFPTPQSRKRRGRPKKTTLPTVFAVQASAQSRRQLEVAPVQEPRLDREDSRASLGQPPAPLELHPALMNPLLASASVRGAFAGGAL